MKHMQRISTWTVFKGEPVCFQAGSEGCSCSRTPGTDVPLSLNATMHPAHELPASTALPWQWGPGGLPEMPRGAGARCLICGFWVSLCRETTMPSLPGRRCMTAHWVGAEDGKLLLLAQEWQRFSLLTFSQQKPPHGSSCSQCWGISCSCHQPTNCPSLSSSRLLLLQYRNPAALVENPCAPHPLTILQPQIITKLLGWALHRIPCLLQQDLLSLRLPLFWDNDWTRSCNSNPWQHLRVGHIAAPQQVSCRTV